MARCQGASEGGKAESGGNGVVWRDPVDCAVGVEVAVLAGGCCVESGGVYGCDEEGGGEHTGRDRVELGV